MARLGSVIFLPHGASNLLDRYQSSTLGACGAACRIFGAAWQESLVNYKT
jgi:hypothetical protein